MRRVQEHRGPHPVSFRVGAAGGRLLVVRGWPRRRQSARDELRQQQEEEDAEEGRFGTHSALGAREAAGAAAGLVGL